MQRLGKSFSSAETGLTIAVAAGCLFMLLAGAPHHYWIINLAALAVALLLIRFAKPPSGKMAASFAIAIIVTLFLLSLTIGPDIDGIRRWIGLGPLRLHSGMLLLPLFAILLPRLSEKARIAAFFGLAILIALQPGRASAAALLAIAASYAAHSPNWKNIAMLAATLAGLSICFMRTDPLGAIPFVENILHDGWQYHPAMGSILALALAGALVPAFLTKRPEQDIALKACYAALAAFVVAAIIGPYPYPLVGYGASSILGVGLALAFRSK